MKIRRLWNYNVEEKYPLNYDLIEELVNKLDELTDVLVGGITLHSSTYDVRTMNKVAMFDLFETWYVVLPSKLGGPHSLREIMRYCFIMKYLFNAMYNNHIMRHAEVLNTCEDPTLAWELYERIKYIINNFETEVFLFNSEEINIDEYH